MKSLSYKDNIGKSETLLKAEMVVMVLLWG